MELWRLGAVALGELIGARQVSSREVVRAHLDRIADVNPTMNAVVEVHATSALAEADAADREIREGGQRGPLHGVPVTVKTNIDMAGHPTTHGVVALADAVSPIDSPHLARLRAAGSIVIGRTNMPDFGFRWSTDSGLYGATRNPWDPARTVGGSSGGEAAAIATGCSPLGLGNDYGGSLRSPAQAAGVASLRPTPGRLPYSNATGPVELSPTLQLFAAQGPMARHTADLRAAFEIMAGEDPVDPWSLPLGMPGPVRPRRVAVIVDPAGLGVDDQVATGVRKAATALTAAGYDVVDIEPPGVAEAAAMWLSLVGTEARLNMAQWTLANEQEQRFVDSFLRVAPELDLGGYVFQLGERQRLTRAWAQFQQQYPIVLGPVGARAPFRVGEDLAGEAAVADIIAAHRLVLAMNLLALPVATVPVGVTEGLPQAVQLIGPRLREDLCLDAAQALQDQVGTLAPIDPLATASLAA